MSQQEPFRIRVYIHTAVNGYAWQGCSEELSESLQTFLGSSMKAAPQDGDVPVGGIRRGEVGGFNGTAVYRLHVRTGGDFKNRDSQYVAVAFLPFARLKDRVVDYAGLWRHELLAEPRGKGEPLENLSIDLEAAGLLVPHPAREAEETRKYWVSARTPGEALEGTDDEVLSVLGSLFQSRKTELGSFSARLFRNADSGLVSVLAKYTPFAAVEAEAAARAEVDRLALPGSGATEPRKAEAFQAWKAAVEALKDLTEEGTGRFRHFLGLVEYAEEEYLSLVGDPKGGLELQTAKALLDRVELLLDSMGRTLTGEQDEMLSTLRTLLKEDVEARLGQIAKGAEEQRTRLRDISGKLETVERASRAVAKWMKDVGDPSFSSDPPEGASSELAKTARLLVECRKDLRSKREQVDRLGANELALKKEIDRLKRENGSLQAKNGARKEKDVSSFEGDLVSDRPRRSFGSLLWKWALKPVLYILLLAGIGTAIWWFVSWYFKPLSEGPSSPRGEGATNAVPSSADWWKRSFPPDEPKPAETTNRTTGAAVFPAASRKPSHDPDSAGASVKTNGLRAMGRPYPTEEPPSSRDSDSDKEASR